MSEPKSLAGFYKTLVAIFLGNDKHHAAGSVVELTHEDAERMLAQKTAVAAEAPKAIASESVEPTPETVPVPDPMPVDAPASIAPSSPTQQQPNRGKNR